MKPELRRWRWFIWFVVVVSVLKDLLNPETFGGAVTTTVIGAGVAWALGALGLHLAQRLTIHRTMWGRFSERPLDDVVYERDFYSLPKVLAIRDSDTVIRFGLVSSDQDLSISQLSIRPVERTGYGGWKNLSKPWAFELKKIECRQVEHERRGHSMASLFNPWHDGKGGFDCLIKHEGFLLEKGTPMWFSVEVQGRGRWSGAIGIRTNIRNGPQLFCRLPIEVVADEKKLRG